MPAPIQFVSTSDDVGIAYRTCGSGYPLVFVRGWISHLEVIGVEPESRAFFDALASMRMVVQYDMRGNGLSDRDVSDLSLDALVLDLEAVVDHLRLESFDLYGQCFGGPIAISYAVKHPERVSRLILDGTYARGHALTTPDKQAALIGGIRAAWEVVSARVISHITAPDSESLTGVASMRHAAMTGETAAQLYELGYQLDITDLVPRIAAPTLVMHRRGSQAVPFHLGRELASEIPNARFVPLEGTAHNPWSGDVDSVLEAVTEFIGGGPAPERVARPTAPTEGSVTILFTDIVGSSALTERLGDSKAREVLREHEQRVREALASHSGSEIKTMGDGFMASFVSATRALECAVAIQRAFDEGAADVATEHGVQLLVRVGLNTGEPVAEDGDLFGTAVNMAARIAAQAQGGEILASNVVRELVAGKGFLFADQGETVLRGFEDPVHLYGVNWRA